jgi:putative ABC transport system substrate-binding protein
MRLVTVIVSLLALSTIVQPVTAQSARTAARVGMLWSASATDATAVPNLEAFRAVLRNHGYAEGRNLVLEHRYAAGRLDRFPELVSNLVRSNVDVIVASSPLSILAAREATSTIPIVIVNGDPRMFSDLTRPGGNVTGLIAFQGELAGKQVELLKEAVPALSRLAVLHNPTQPVHSLKLKEAQHVARALGMSVFVADARSADELDSAFSAIAKERVGGIVVFADGAYYTNRARIADLALRQGLPTVFGSPGAADAGGFMTYLPNGAETYGRAGDYVSRILKGAHPGDLPIEQPTRFELAINMKTARALRVTVPQALVLRADRLIE